MVSQVQVSVCKAFAEVEVLLSLSAAASSAVGLSTVCHTMVSTAIQLLLRRSGDRTPCVASAEERGCVSFREAFLKSHWLWLGHMPIPEPITASRVISWRT